MMTDGVAAVLEYQGGIDDICWYWDGNTNQVTFCSQMAGIHWNQSGSLAMILASTKVCYCYSDVEGEKILMKMQN